MNSLRLYTILFLLSIGFIQSSAQADAAKAYVKVDREVTKKLMLSADDLAKMKQSSVTLKDHDGKEHVYANKPAILADMSDGKPLSNEIGPFRFVVSGEKKGARSCYMVTELLVKFAKD